MSDIVTARLFLRPITAEEVSAVLLGRRRSDWAADFPTEGDPPQDGEVEIGYGIVPSRQRRGYATEAVQAMVADILQLDAVQAVIANVDLDNPASIRVLEKSGMMLGVRREQQATYHIRRADRANPRGGS
jgi:[ribosomal protein S5]-alanine N-acetyltransferase